MYILGIIESLLLVMLVYMIFIMIFYKNELDMEGISSYECGFEPKSYARFTFSYRFFLISILFIIFDVEISLMLPVPFLVDSEIGMWIMDSFLFILIFGLMYEYFCGSLNWLDLHN